MKKKLTPMQIHDEIRKAISNNPEFKEVVFDYDFCKWVRKTQNGHFTVTTTTTCEGSIIGTFSIIYTTSNDEYDVHSGFICMNDKPEWIINEILNHTDPTSVDLYESIEPVCPNCGSHLISDNDHPYTNKYGNYCYTEFICDSCGCEFDEPEKKEVNNRV